MNETNKAKKLFVIDDDEIFHFSVRRLNKRAEAFQEVVLFSSAEAALRSLKALLHKKGSFPEIILLDINMPKMNGWDFLNSFSALGANNVERTKIYIVSSSIDSRDVAKAGYHPLISGYISKPLQADVLHMLGKSI